MPAKMAVELPDGKRLILGGGGPTTGLSEVGIADQITKAASDAFKGALSTLARLVGMLEETVGRMEHRPDKVEMEFRVSLSSECDLWIVSGDGDAEFKVTISWGKGE
jgi:hypothetical protein